MLLKLGLLAAGLIVGYFVGRRNPHIGVVNDLIAAGEWVKDATGKLIKKL
jgi:hypothetical protein